MIEINIRLTYNSQTIKIELEDTQNNIQITELKEIIKNKLNEQNDFRLIFAGKVLKENDILSSVGITNNSTLHLVRSKPIQQAPKPTQPEEMKQPNFASQEPSRTESNIPNVPQNNFTSQQPSFPGFVPPNNFASQPFPNGGMGGMSIDQAMNMIEQNPEMIDMTINFMTQNPQLLRQMLMMNPQVAQMMNDPMMGPMVEQMLSNPEMLRMMFNPQMMQMARGMAGNMNMNNMNIPPTNNNMNNMNMNVPPTNNNNNMNNANPFAGLFGMNVPPTNNNNMNMNMNVPNNNNNMNMNMNMRSSRDMYADQLNQLKDMGFYDEATNLRVLERTGGNVSAAVEMLLNNSFY